MINIQQVSKSFDVSREESLPVLNNLSLQIKHGEYLILIGSNGSGKSTLLNLIAGTLSPDNGSVALDSQMTSDMAEYQLASLLSRVFQDPKAGTASDLTILENFRLAYLRSKPKRLHLGINPRFRQLVKTHLSELQMGLEHQLNKPVGQLSGGQRQALTISMAMINPPRYLLMDEPTAALDPETATKVLKIADHYIHKHDITTIHITHNLKEALEYGNRLILLKNGSVAKDLNNKQKSSLTLKEMLGWYHQ